MAGFYRVRVAHSAGALWGPGLGTRCCKQLRARFLTHAHPRLLTRLFMHLRTQLRTHLHTHLHTCCCLLLAIAVSGCAQLDTGLKKAVIIKYDHLANVRSFQANIDNHSSLLFPVQSGSFWAIFEVCSIDVQGKDLSGFSYDVDRFVADAGNGSYPATSDGLVNVASVPMAARSPTVRAAAFQVFALGPAAQYFPRQFYPSLRYRFAIFIPESPIGYHNDTMLLRYDGAPQAAVVAQHQGRERPAVLDFYLPAAGPPLASGCQ